MLDIGCWDGWFSFRAEREGAARVVALDHYVWSLDLPRQQAYWRDCRDRGVTPEPYHERPELWQPDTLPGKTAFDLAHKRLESRVEPVVGDFMTMDLGALGAFDVVIESAALVVGDAAEPLWQFVPGVELNADVGNCRPTGRRRVLPADGPCPRLTTSRRGRLRSSC